MVDKLSKEHRSWNMGRIRSTNTKPELFLRSKLHLQGYRFRLHGAISKKINNKGFLPGKPDIVLPKYKTVIFVHGCFWHRHDDCPETTGATFLVLHKKDEFITDSIWYVGNDGPKIYSQLEWASSSYDGSITGSHLVYEIKKCPDKYFLNIKWDLRELDLYMKNYKSAIPFSVSLLDFMQAKVVE